MIFDQTLMMSYVEKNRMTKIRIDSDRKAFLSNHLDNFLLAYNKKKTIEETCIKRHSHSTIASFKSDY
jgi:hypothetical protein